MARSIHGPSGGGDGVLRMLERTGVRKGMGGSKGWFYLGTGLWTLRTIRRMAGDKEEILISERLEPGDRIVISNGRATIEGQAQATAPAGRRARKKAAKAEQKATRKATEKAAKKANKKAAKAPSPSA